MIYKLVIALLLLVGFSTTQIFASVYFEDNFNNGNSIKWSQRRNSCQTAQWQVINNKYGISIVNPSPCVTEVTPTDDFWNSNWNDYFYELDFSPVSGFDKNLAWRYESPSSWLGIHVIGDKVDFQRIQLSESSNKKPVVNGQTYRFKIRAEGNMHEVWYYNINDPEEVSYMKGFQTSNLYMTGRIALQASVGNVNNSSVWFDNIKVTSLDDDQPLGLNIPHFSQVDPTWSSIIYDHADSFSPSNHFISDLGCALTSATMILNYHQANLGPAGQPTTPSTLNQYLIDNRGYTSGGGVIWSSFSSYVRNAKASGQLASDIPDLEFSYPQTYDLDLIKSDLEQENPAILKLSGPSNNHFVVARHVDDADNIYINDPLDSSYQERKLSEAYPGRDITAMGRFIPSQTDLSYLWIHANNPQIDMVVDLEGQKTGSSEGQGYAQITGANYYVELPVAVGGSLNEDGAMGKSLVFSLPKPDIKTYKITLTSPSDQSVTLDFDIYDAAGASWGQTKTVQVVGGIPTTFDLKLVEDLEAESPTLQETSSYLKLLQAVNQAYQVGEITSKGTRNSLLAQALASYLLHERLPKPAKVLLRNFGKTLDREKGKSITQAGYDSINHHYQLLTTQLGW